MCFRWHILRSNRFVAILLIRIFFRQQKCAVVIWYFCWIRRQIGFSRQQFFFFNMPLPLVFLVVCSKQINQCTPMLASIIFLWELNWTEVHWAQVNVLHSRVNVLYSPVLKSVCSWGWWMNEDYAPSYNQKLFAAYP